MIITKLYGGLGNQMFQYATGKALAIKNKTNLYLDCSWFDEIKGNPDVVQRVYELDGFGILPESLSPIDRLSKKLKAPVVFTEAHLDFNEGFAALRGNIILDGYWQSHKYFEDYRNMILSDFLFPNADSKETQSILDQITSNESVSIHIRRGDYNTAKGRSYHGLITPDYYYKAVLELKKTVQRPHLFVFSDEIEWCKKNLRFDDPVSFVDSNTPRTGVQDMHMMSACQHNIIANSSFSWWGAWLNSNNSKIVIAPKDWFRAVDVVLEDRIPSSWKLM